MAYRAVLVNPYCGTGGRWFEPTQLYHKINSLAEIGGFAGSLSEDFSECAAAFTRPISHMALMRLITVQVVANLMMKGSGASLEARRRSPILRLAWPPFPTEDLKMSTTTESAVRARAKRNGYLLRKSRRSIDLENFGQYMLVDADTNTVALGSRFDADLDAIAKFLDCTKGSPALGTGGW